MLIALFADIHANRQAFDACLAQARDFGAQRFVLLGDYVGYGADPDWTVTTVMELVDKGARAVLGNHDSAIGNPQRTNESGGQDRHRMDARRTGRFATAIPGRVCRSRVTDDDRLYVHSEAYSPASWTYVTSTVEASRSIIATSAQVCFCGHIHRPAIYSMSPTAKMTAFTPITGAAVPLLQGRRWLAVLGSVGQPRDGNPAASFAMFDTDKRELTYCRVPYDVEQAVAAIRKKGLPRWLADRLFVGQ